MMLFTLYQFICREIWDAMITYCIYVAVPIICESEIGQSYIADMYPNIIAHIFFLHTAYSYLKL